MPIENAYSQLGTRFWITKDLDALQSAYEDLTARRINPAEATSVQEFKTSDRRLLSLVRTGVTDKFENVFGRAKAFADKLNPDTLAYNGALARELGGGADGLRTLAKSVCDLYWSHEGQKTAFADDTPKVSQEQAETMLKVMLATVDFKEISVEGLQDVDKDQIRLSLVNATLGALKLVEAKQASVDSIFELAKGELYDLAKGTAVYKLSVLTAHRAREAFIDRKGLEALAAQFDRAHPNDALGQQRVRDCIARIVDERTRLSAILDVSYDVGDGTTATVEKKLKEVREHMRAFRYDLERLNGTKMGRMESMRRWFDDIGGVTQGRITSASAFDDERDALFNLNLLLRGTGEARSCLGAESTHKATDLTHMANNAIRYYLSGHERKLDAFNEKAHQIFDDMGAGGSRTVKFTLGASLGAKLGIAKGEIGANYVHTATIAKSGGEYVITHLDGLELKASASVGLGYQDGSDDDGSSEKGSMVVGGKLAAGASASGSYKRSVSYKNVSDLIADLGGSSEILDATHRSTRLCLGRIWMGIKLVGGLVKDAVTAMGFREHHSRLDQNIYLARLVQEGILGNMDQMLSQQTRALKTVESSAFVIDGSVNGSASVAVGRFDGVDDDEKTTSTSLFEAGLSAKGSISRETFVKSTTYRPLTERLANHSEDWVLGKAGGTHRMARSAEDAKARLQAMEAEMRALEAKTEDQRANGAGELTNDQIGAFADAWTKLAAEAELLKREWSEHLDAEEVPMDDPARRQMEETCVYVASRLDRPRVTMSDDQFKEFFLDRQFVGGNGTVTKSFETSVNIGALNGLSTLVDEKTGVAEMASDTVGQTVAQDLASGVINTPLQGFNDTVLPLSQSVTFKVTSSHMVKQGDVRPWSNGNTTDIEVSFSTNLGARWLASKIADLVFEDKVDDLETDRPDLLENFTEDLKFNLEFAAKDLAETTGNDALMGFLGLDGKKNGSEAGCTNNVTLKLHFEAGRLVSIAETETLTTSGTLKAAVSYHGVEIGLKMSDSLTESSTKRSVMVNASLDALLGTAATQARAGAGVVSMKGVCAKQHRSVIRLLQAMQCNGVRPADRPNLPQDNKFMADITAVHARHQEAERLLDLMEDHVNDDLADRAEHLREKLDADYNRLANLNLDDSATRQEQVDVAANLFADLAAIFTLAKEGGMSRTDAENAV